jgi:glycosyltransferase involved in cell wall biosynthesis
MLPAAYAGAAARRKPFILWASVWAQPRSVAHVVALPVTRHIYRHANAVVAYGEHVKRFVAGIRGRDGDVFVAPQSVEPELFGRDVSASETEAFRTRHGLGTEKLVLYTGRLVPEKGIDVLVKAWDEIATQATLVVIGDGPLARGSAPFANPVSVSDRPSGKPARKIRFLGALPRAELPVAYAASALTVVPSIPTPRFREPWGLVCNEAMHQARPVVATRAVGAAAGGLVRDDDTGLLVEPGDPHALAATIDRLLKDPALRSRLGENGRRAVAHHTYDAMVEAFGSAFAAAGLST